MDFKLSGLVNCEVCSLVLISKGMSSNNNGFLPSRYQSGDVIDDDRFSEDSSVENVPDCAIGTFPHLLQIELFDSGLVRRDSGTFDADLALLDGISGIYGNLVVCGISMLDTEIKVFDVEIEEWEDEFVFDGFPDDSGHLIAIKFGNGVLDFDFASVHV